MLKRIHFLVLRLPMHIHEFTLLSEECSAKRLDPPVRYPAAGEVVTQGM